MTAGWTDGPAGDGPAAGGRGPALCEGRVIAQREVAPGHLCLRFRAPAVAAAALPGQFVHVLCGWGPAGDGIYRYLRRPFSLLRASPPRGEAEFVYRVQGDGTRWLSRLRPGAPLSVLGPLGRAFPDPPAELAAVLVGGGVGVPPLFFLARRLRGLGRPVSVILGARTRSLLLLEGAFRRLGCTVTVTTEDGSRGRRGLVTAPLEERLAAGGVVVYACGPLPMLAAIQAQLARRSAPGYLAVEERMACGVGACLGCPVPVVAGAGTDPVAAVEAAGAGRTSAALPAAGPPADDRLAAAYAELERARRGEAALRYARVCVDGPVFPSWEVAL